MKKSDRICNKISIKSNKQRQAYLKRQQQYIPGTPKVILGKQFQNNVQQIWTDELKNEPVIRLKQLNSDQKAFNYAWIIINTTAKLSQRYGYFIINENMTFFNEKRQIFVWINPDIFENTVKIYVPNSPDGQLMMIRSIISFLKLWLKCDYVFLAQSKKLDQLIFRFDQLISKLTQQFKPKSPQKLNFVASTNLLTPLKPPIIKREGNNILNENLSNRQIKSPTKQQKLILSMSNKQKPILKNLTQSQQTLKLKNRTTQSRNTDKKSSDKNVQQFEGNFQHKSFNNINSSIKLKLNKSQGIKGGNYFPNKSTSNKNHIIQIITNQMNDNQGQQYKQNKILLGDQEYNRILQRQKLKKMKESLQGIGQEVNQLFFSNIQSDDGKQQELKKMEQQFGNLLD